MAKKNILARLTGGDRRSIGRADEVAAIISRDSALFPQLIAGLSSEDPLLAMRAADAAEKITRTHPELLQRHKKNLLRLLTTATQQELRWHLAAMVPRLALNTKERRAAIAALKPYLEDGSSIVKTCALQGLADLAEAEPSFRPEITSILRAALQNGTPAMQARSRKLLPRLRGMP